MIRTSLVSKIGVVWMLGLSLCWTAVGGQAMVGRTLPAWQEGSLEIHHINTGRGDATFFVFPDGTTMLFDAGDLEDTARPAGYIPPRRPDGSRPTGEWIGRYIRARHPRHEQPVLDFAVMSHFHADHINAIADVAGLVPIRKMLDRAGPGDASFPDNATTRRYRAFVERQMERGMELQRFQAGRDDQLVLRFAPERYPQFQIRNLAVNGRVWTGEGSAARQAIADASNENMMSAAFVLRYGDFGYYLGADLLEPMEKAMVPVIAPVDVHVANHHGSQAHPNFLGRLRPRIHIVHVWAVIQPRPHVFERLFDESIYPGPRDVFLTNGLWPGRAEHFLDRYNERVASLIDNYTVEVGQTYIGDYMPKVASDQGHIVVRVDPDGKRYRILVLEDRDESLTVKSIHGPYQSRPAEPGCDPSKAEGSG